MQPSSCPSWRVASTVGESAVTRAGRSVGEHQGLANYTIGQRKGIGVAAPEPLYVVKLDAATRAHLNGRQMALVPQSIAHLDPLVCGRSSMNYETFQLADLDLAKLKLTKETVFWDGNRDHSRWMFRNRGQTNGAEKRDLYFKIWNPTPRCRENAGIISS